MRKCGWIDEKYGIDAKDTSQWLPVNTNNFNQHKKERYNQRKRAIDLYLNSDKTVKEILNCCSISQTELNRILHRALTVNEYGYVSGYHACIPGFNIKKYTRTSHGDNGKAGRFSQFLEKFPEIKEHLDDLALGKVRINESKVRGPYYKRIWKVFKELCKEYDIDIMHDYPFTNSDGGQEALRQYCKNIRDKNFVQGSFTLYGDQSGLLAAQASSNKLKHIPLQPYDLTQLDGHKIDGKLKIRMQDPQGEIQFLDIERFWILLLIDVASRGVLGYSFGLSRNYNSESFLECIGNSYVPWIEKDIPIKGINYLPNAGLPSGVIEQCAWRNYNSLQLDNAFVHLSEWVQNKVIDSGALQVITNIPRHCRSNSIVERFFLTFEEYTMHQWPNTSGSNPKDPRLSNPDKEANRLCVEYEDLEIIIDIAIANYNASPHSSLNGRTPLEFINYYIDDQKQLIRHQRNEEQDPNNCSLFKRQFSRTIRGNPATGHLPYITFHKAKYSSSFLKHNPEIIGKSVIFEVNIKDIRSGTIYLEDGTNLGELIVEDRWAVVPHSLRTRQIINSMTKKKILEHNLNAPVEGYMTYLADRALTTRKERNKLIEMQLETGKDASKIEIVHTNINHIKKDDPNWISINKAFGE